jgi:nitrile hydratase accessory protein
MCGWTCGNPILNRPEGFDEPWQAEAFALTHRLADTGVFTWAEWTDALSAAIRADETAEYYAQWVAALESLIMAKGLLSAEVLEDRREAWEHAYLHTPHGQPVVLL